MRQSPRHPVEIHCFLELPGGASWPALVTDISYGGVGIETTRAPESLASFELVMLHGEAPGRLPCTARHVRSIWTRHIIHAEFTELTVEQRHSVERVIHELNVTERPTRRGRWAAFRQQLSADRT